VRSASTPAGSVATAPTKSRPPGAARCPRPRCAGRAAAGWRCFPRLRRLRCRGRGRWPGPPLRGVVRVRRPRRRVAA
jgi:hypothetical protein